MRTASTLSRQLRLNVHPADGALLVGDEPLVHAQLVEEVHTRESSGGGNGPDMSAPLVVRHTSTFLWFLYRKTRTKKMPCLPITKVNALGAHCSLPPVGGGNPAVKNT